MEVIRRSNTEFFALTVFPNSQLSFDLNEAYSLNILNLEVIRGHDRS